MGLPNRTAVIKLCLLLYLDLLEGNDYHIAGVTSERISALLHHEDQRTYRYTEAKRTNGTRCANGTRNGRKKSP
jgi:hypothetical protein